MISRGTLGLELFAVIFLNTCWRLWSERLYGALDVDGFLNASRVRKPPCKFGKEDMYLAPDDAGERKYGMRDPRNQGYAAKLLRLFRGAVGTRRVALQLTGYQASRLVLAQYGIVTAVVPDACFGPLKFALDTEGMDLDDIKQMRPGLLEILKNGLPNSCSETGERTEEGFRAAMMLKALRFGYWVLYEPETVESANIIAARNIDLRRASKGDMRLRQIWHFAKMHLLQSTELLVRQEILNARGRKERKRLVRQMGGLVKLEGMRDARLEFVELDVKGSCISAPKHEVASILEALRNFKSARFRATLLFRERYFQSLAESAWHTLKHPIYSIRKFGTRWADEWSRGTTGHKFAMIVKPLLKTATLAGLVLGVATMGTSTFPALFVEHALGQERLAEIFFESSMISFAISKLFQQPVVDALTDDVLAKGEANTKLQAFLAKLDDDWAVSDMRAQLEGEVERIMDSNETRVPMEMYEAEWAEQAGADEDEESGIEEEVRRIVSGMVYNGFLGEVSPLIQELLVKAKAKDQPDYGWLPWAKWRKFRKGSNAKSLVGGRLRVDSEDEFWEGKVLKVGSKFSCLPGMCNRKVDVEIDDEVYTLKLTKKMKSQLIVFDPPAYQRSQPGWLLWHDWSEYRKTSDSMELKGKELFIDVELPGCSDWEGSCASSLDEDGHGALVTTTRWKPFGQGFRTIKVAPDPGTVCKLVLSPDLKACLRVNDGHAYQRFIEDAPRREEEELWSSGDLSTVQQEVVTAMACAPQMQATMKGRAGLGNGVLRKELGQSSVELEMEESDDGAQDSEEEEVMEAVEDGFVSATEHEC